MNSGGCDNLYKPFFFGKKKYAFVLNDTQCSITKKALNSKFVSLKGWCRILFHLSNEILRVNEKGRQSL